MRTPAKRNVRVTIDCDFPAGEYEISYKNQSHPGQPIDFTEVIGFLRRVFSQHERVVSGDADTNETGQASRDTDDFQ